MNERDVGQKIARQLNYGLTQLRPETAERLRLAREHALSAHHEPAVEHARGLVFAGGLGHAPGHLFHAGKKLVNGVVIVAILAAAGAMYMYWYNAGQEQDVFDVDAVLLAEDLPINAYLNKDFQEWLEHSPEQPPPPSS